MRPLVPAWALACAAIPGAGPTPTLTSRPQHCLNDAQLLRSAQVVCSISSAEDIVFPVLNVGVGTGPSRWKGSPGQNIPSEPLLVDKATPVPNPFHPWSYEPFCTPILDEIGSPLCVFTDISFSHGRGISIFTTAKIASEFLSLSPFRDPTAASSVSEDGTRININTDTDAWVTQAVPSKGIGMLAARNLARGDLIMAYTPVFIAFPEQSLGTAERERFWRRAVDQLPVKSKDLYLGLATIFGDERFKAQDVLKANTFEVQVGGLMHLAIWPEAARMNHECGPNSQYRIDHTQLVHYVHAARPISKGDEITITYIDPFLPHANRQATLRETFHFTCTCPRCASSSTSDAALTQISALQAVLNDWSTTSNPDSDPPRDSNPGPQEAETLISLYKSEGLHGFLDMPYGHATLAYSAVGDAEGVKMYAGLAGEAVALKDGKGRGDWKLWNGLEKEPRAHWSWRRSIV